MLIWKRRTNKRRETEEDVNGGTGATVKIGMIVSLVGQVKTVWIITCREVALQDNAPNSGTGGIANSWPLRQDATEVKLVNIFILRRPSN